MNETKLAEYEISGSTDKLNVVFLGDATEPDVRVWLNDKPFFAGSAETLIVAVAGLHNLFAQLSEKTRESRGTGGEAPTGAA